MRKVKCQTPGCGGFSTNIPAENLIFCQCCGWPLGRAELNPNGGKVAVPKGTRGQIAIRIRNIGDGKLRWDTGGLPRGLHRIDRALDILPGEEGQVTVEVDADQLESPELFIPVRTWDRHGKDRTDFRLESPDLAFQESGITFATRTTRLGPLLCPIQSLLFFPQDTKHKIRLENLGESELSLELSCTGCTVAVPLCTELRGRQRSGSFRMDAGTQKTPEIRMDDGVSEAHISISCPQVWSEPLVVRARRVEPVPVEHPEYQYVVAIDFGTTKSAVMVFDQWRLGAKPEPILWPKPDGKDEWYIPSEVRLRDGRPTDFGWLAGDTDEVVKSVKTQLIDGSDLARHCVTYLLERLLDRVAEVKGSELLSQAQVVFSLPVLDDGERFEAQRRTTLECALEAGRKYGLRSEQFATYTEPECAMVDILDAMKGGASVHPSEGDWLCVVDMGGGTTDISLTQFGLGEKGKPELRNLKVAGFSRAGDFIDQELFLYCLRTWAESDRLLGSCPSAFTPELLEQPLKLKGETTPLMQSKLYEETRRAKEYMYDHTPQRGYTLDSFTVKRNHLHLNPEELNHRLIRNTVKALFEGSSLLGEDSLRNHLQDWGIPIDQIRFLFLTGGTSRLPSVLEVLKGDYLRSPKLTSLPNPEPRKNVVRGAALRPSLMLPNMLPVDLNLRLGGKATELKKGAIMGSQISLATPVQRGQTIALEVEAKLENATLTLAKLPLEYPSNAKTNSLVVKVHLRYSPQGKLELEGEWLVEPADRFLSSVVAQFPVEEGTR